MARSEARVSVDIWADPDFRALTTAAQRLYFFLLSQPDIAHDGVLALRERRWAGTAHGLGTGQVRVDLLELARARFVVIDDDTEELLVRSFIRRDGVYRQPNLLRAARKHLALVESPAVRAVLRVELQRIRHLDDTPKGSLDVIDGMLAELLANPSPNPSSPEPGPGIDDHERGGESAGEEASSNPSGNPSPNPSPMPLGDRGVVTAVTTGGPYPLSPEPLPLPPSAGSAVALAAPTTTQALVGEWIDHCRRRPPAPVIGQVSKQVKAMLAEGIDPAEVRAGLAAWHRRGVHPSVLPSIVNEVMNAAPSRASPRPSTTDQRVGAALALADQLEAQEGP